MKLERDECGPWGWKRSKHEGESLRGECRESRMEEEKVDGGGGRWKVRGWKVESVKVEGARVEGGRCDGGR